jgi:UDP-2,4-diacetamido-2,4,6-trideoxy-beta-L-altropyranose hydrolase
MKIVKIFTIGGKETGYGHIARIIPIYDAFRKYKCSVEIYIAGDDSVLKITESRNVIFMDWEKSSRLDFLSKSNIIFIDTLVPPENFILNSSKFTKNIFFISDGVGTNKYLFKVINWRVGAEEIMGANGLYGEKYVPIRLEVLNASVHPKNLKSRELVVSMGAGDVLNLIPRTLEILDKNYKGSFILKVVIQSFHPEFKNLIDKYQDQINFLVDMCPNQLFRAIASCQFAIASGGHSIYEFAYLGVPVVHVLVADNQEAAKCWDSSGFTFPVGRYNPLVYEKLIHEGVQFFMDEGNLSRAASRGRQLIDGGGAKRIVMILNKEST